MHLKSLYKISNPLLKIPCDTAKYKSPAFLFFNSFANPKKVPPPSQISSTMIHGLLFKSSAYTSNPVILPVATSLVLSHLIIG